MPAQEALGRQRRCGTGGGVEHHVDDALDVTVHRRDRTDVHTEAPCDGRAHRCHVQHFALDLAGLDHVLGQRRQAGLIAQRHADIGQAAEQHPLGTAGFGQRPGQGRQVVAPVRPVGGLPDVALFSAVHAEIKARYSPQGQVIHRSYCSECCCNSPIESGTMGAAPPEGAAPGAPRAQTG